MKSALHHKKYFKFAGVLVLFFSFFFTGCVSHFANPLTKVGEQKLDASIFGTWYWNKDRESGYIHIGEDKAPGLLKIAMVEFDSENKMKISQWSGHTSVFSDTKYLNLKWIYPEDQKHEGYLIFKYETKKDEFGLYFIKDSLIESAVKDKALEGKIVGEGSSSSAWVTQDQDKLVQYILKNHKTLYDDLTVFPKLTLP